MRRFQVLSLALLVVVASVLGSGDDGPGDPEFSPNDGELENAVNPLKAPEGNYNIATEKGVSVLNRDTFAYFVMPKDLVLVEFYAPECVHCKKLEPGKFNFHHLLSSHFLIYFLFCFSFKSNFLSFDFNNYLCFLSWVLHFRQFCTVNTLSVCSVRLAIFALLSKK
jgi:thiol-disulfide isomerase/thioredoxin